MSVDGIYGLIAGFAFGVAFTCAVMALLTALE